MDFATWIQLASSWPIDWVFICAAIVLIALDALRSGSARAASLALALPASFFIFNAIPQSFFLGPLIAAWTAPFVQVCIFFALLTLIFFATYRTIFSSSDGGRVIQSLTVGIAAVAALLVVWLQIPALDSLWHFGDHVQAVFAPAYRFWWLVGVFLALAFARS